MTSPEREYYEQRAFWDFDYRTIPAEKERIERTIASIPPEVRTLLDAGCGNGNLINALLDRQPSQLDRIVGLDWSAEALRHVRSEKRQGSVTELPFAVGEFDLVTSLEVIEHLPQSDFDKAIAEYQRVARRFIMVTVPNREDLERSLVACARCRCRFNPHFHMRSFDDATLRNLFSKFECIELQAIGPEISYVALGRFAIALARSLRPPRPPSTAICPQCGHRQADNSNEAENGSAARPADSPARRALRSILPTVSRRRWLHALYRRR
jgi:SAM-dependent methyltransferase